MKLDRAITIAAYIGLILSIAWSVRTIDRTEDNQCVLGAATAVLVVSTADESLLDTNDAALVGQAIRVIRDRCDIRVDP